MGGVQETVVVVLVPDAIECGLARGVRRKPVGNVVKRISWRRMDDACTICASR